MVTIGETNKMPINIEDTYKKCTCSEDTANTCKHQIADTPFNNKKIYCELRRK